MSGKNDALIIVPPFASTAYPAVGPHAVQASAREAGLNTKILYANISFACFAGWDVYEALRENDAGFGEWVFADVAFEGLSAKQHIEKLSNPAWISAQNDAGCH